MLIVPCGWVSSTSSRTGRVRPGINAPTRPSGRRVHVNVVRLDAISRRSAAAAVTSLNVEPGGYSPYLARSSSASVSVERRRSDHESERGKRIARDRQEVAGVRVDDDGCRLAASRLLRIVGQDRGHAKLEMRINGEMHIARSGQQRLRRRVVGIVPMSQQRDHLTIVAPNGQRRAVRTDRVSGLSSRGRRSRAGGPPRPARCRTYWWRSNSAGSMSRPTNERPRRRGDSSVRSDRRRWH